tara:strand:+ start:518 stop:706 length:189 start_codon:yes stop_codon:yes gene_type:complete
MARSGKLRTIEKILENARDNTLEGYYDMYLIPETSPNPTNFYMSLIQELLDVINPEEEKWER